MKYFLKNLFKHPGTWVLSALALTALAIAVPPAAPFLIAGAAGCMVVGGVTTFPYVKGFFDRLKGRDLQLIGDVLSWAVKHPYQALAVANSLALFVTALVLTIGFFTGGAGFVFMAPVFSALAAPFIATNVAAGISLFVPALAGFAFVLAPLTLGNNLKRFLGWLDSFKYDYLAAKESHNVIVEDTDVNLWTKQRKDFAEQEKRESYLFEIKGGILATICPTKEKGWFTSPDAERLQAEEKKSVIYHS